MAENLFDLTGKVALITGGNAGLGLGWARGLARAGADIVIWGRREEKNRGAVAELERYGTRVAARAVDVSDEQQVIEGMSAAVSEMGRLDCVIANAGFATMSPMVDMTSETYHQLINVSQHGAFYTLREAARHMVARSKAGEPGGSLIACGSLSIFQGVAGMTHYAAAKGAIQSLTRSLAVELGPHQIRVNVVAPGFIASEMTQADPEVFKQLDAAVSESTPLGRSGQPEDLEGIVVYLASDLSRYHTGDTFVIDGGKRIKN
jgi:NAD(P)-dependent dehydrogenase (short-subunit alcohol dehydrogenase family)